MSAWRKLSAAATALAGVAVACTNGSGGTGPAPTPPGIGYEVPTTPYQPSGGQEQPTNPYQPPGGQPGGSSGGGGGGGCSYCGQTYTCSATYDGQTESSSTVTLPPAQGDSCGITDDAGTASFSCDGTISYDGASLNWTPTGNGGFTYTISTTETANQGGTSTPVTTTTTATVTCTPGATVSAPVGGEDAG